MKLITSRTYNFLSDFWLFLVSAAELWNGHQHFMLISGQAENTGKFESLNSKLRSSISHMLYILIFMLTDL